jgi:glucose/arabinose dehydrogenase
MMTRSSFNFFGENSNFRKTGIILMFCFCLLIFGLVGETWAEPGITADLVATGFSFPVDINNAGDGSDRLFIVEQAGRIKIIEDGAVLSTSFLDISNLVSCCDEQGLLGIAFHPDYAINGFFYVNYTNIDGDTVIARYSVSTTDHNIADPASAQIILTVQQPFPIHNAGKLLFSPLDGYLYIPLGDGGNLKDPGDLAQDTGTLLGKVLRIDVNNGSPYGIPPDNPFVGPGDPLDEIWAIGMRNPWRFSFDRANSDIYIGDVGHNLWEEIDYQAAGTPGGLNFGWPCREGAHDFNFSGNCSQLTLTDPIAEYGHSGGWPSVTGGFVYRGNQYAALFGCYIFADYRSGRIWTIYKAGPNTWTLPELELDTDYLISTFGEDEGGELYFAHRDSSTGTIYHIADNCEADIIHDNIVNDLDLQAFVEDYGRSDCSEDCAADFKNDGDVDGRNLLTVIFDYGREDCP